MRIDLTDTVGRSSQDIAHSSQSQAATVGASRRIHAKIFTRLLQACVLWLSAAVAAHADPIVKLLTFQDSPDPVPSTTTLTYQLQVSNTDFNASAANVVLVVPIPSGATFVSVSDVACSYSSPNVVCNFGTVPANTDKFIHQDCIV